MRLALEEPRLDCPPVSEVKLNLHCRDEIISILRALQHLYEDAPARCELLDLVGKDVNGNSSHLLGRCGLDYWSITVLAAVRLGCNLDYDKLQDLAEQHRNLRLMMGIGDWQEKDTFDWRRIRDNLCLLRPATLEKINHLLVGLGHQLAPEAAKAVRGDSFAVETNIHYPTESSLIADGLRKLAPLAAELAEEHGLAGWRQYKHLLKNVKDIGREIGRASRAKSQGADRFKPGYQKLLELAEDMLERARQLLQALVFSVTAAPAEDLLSGVADNRQQQLLHYMLLTEQV